MKPVSPEVYRAALDKIDALKNLAYIERCRCHDLIVAVLEGRETMDHEEPPRSISTAKFMRAIKKAIGAAGDVKPAKPRCHHSINQNTTLTGAMPGPLTCWICGFVLGDETPHCSHCGGGHWVARCELLTPKLGLP